MKFHYSLGTALLMCLQCMDIQAGESGISSMNNQNGIYVGIEGGWTKVESPQSGPASLPRVNIVSESFDNGYNIGLRGGYQWGSIRLEEEFRYQKNSINSITDGVPPKTSPATGSRSAYAFMTNAIYDLNLGWKLTPHVGGGIGVVGLNDEWIVPIGRCDDDTVWKFGYQAIAGGRYNLTPTIAIDFDYRYLGTNDPTFIFSGNGADRAGITGSTFSSGYGTHNIIASLTVKV